MLCREVVQRVLVPHGDHELLARDAELAGGAVERRERDLLEHLLHASRVAPVALRTGVGDRGGVVRGAAEGDVRDEHGCDRADRDEQR